MSTEHDKQSINEKARRAGTTPERVAQHKVNGEDALSSDQPSTAAPGQLNAARPQDGFGTTEAGNYEQQPQEPVQEVKEYDPTHSGARHAQNKPGKRPEVPGREGESAWSEPRQMGNTTDTPERKNPAN